MHDTDPIRRGAAEPAPYQDTPASTDPASSDRVDIGAFCRAVESHLCRVNGGHLVRIVGPAFELVSDWAREGMPLRVVLHGVDRTIARLSAKGPRRRPVRIEFCDADVRDTHDQWRRAVGVHAANLAAADAPAGGVGAPVASRVPSLPKHLERVLVRLSSLLATCELPPPLGDALTVTIRDVDACLDASRGARGEARVSLLGRLVEIEQAMTTAALLALTDAQRGTLEEQVRTELAPYRGQMPPDAFGEAQQALLAELTRRHHSLPQVRLDG
jgi:hypothetical protein